MALSSTLNRVMYMNAAIARVRTAETMTTHISSAVNVLRRRLPETAAAAAAEIIEQAHCSTIPYPFSRPLDAAGESS